MSMASSSATVAASADVLPQPKYDVFLSFRGEDTRHKFISHLYAALCRKKIYTFMDDKLLERGDEIGPALLTAIKQSKISIIIFSKDYASSTWCLDELVHILKCKEAHGQLVIPVFYDIDPSHVRWQQETYKNSFAILEQRFKDNLEKVSDWRAALKTAASLSGAHSQSENIRHEYELVETIVEDVGKKLNRNSLYVVKGLVGMDNHIQRVELLLHINSGNVFSGAIGIWGMGGIGKTTLADAVYHQNKFAFDACVFLANVREEAEKHNGLIQLRNELLRKLLKEEHLSIGSPSIGSSYVLDRLSRSKVLVVLDDVSDTSQLDFLLGDQVQFGPGSRFILTTRDKRVLKKKVHPDHIYKMNGLYVNEAIQLFQSIAFQEGSSTTEYSDLSERVVRLAGYNPLALTVLASSFLHCNNREEWEEELKKLKKNPNKKIQKVLRWSYDGLEENEQGIFHHIACFLKGEDICDAKRKLEMHGFSASCGIKVLNDMSLISISKKNRLGMHDLLQDMGRAIESGIQELGKRKRLWNTEDSYQVLHNETGTSTVEALSLNMIKIKELQLNPRAFRNMPNLKFLKLYIPQELREDWKRQRILKIEENQLSSFPLFRWLKSAESFLAKFGIWGSQNFGNYDYEGFKKYCKVYLPKGLETLPQQLRYLSWDGYPCKSLPSKYYPDNLVELHMPHSQVKQLWSNVQNLGSLKHLNLSHSRHLTEVPDLSGSSDIETVDLNGCTSLVELPPYFQNLENLKSLDLRDCKNLTIFWEIPCNLEELNLYGSGIKEISPSIWCHEKLHTLDISFCRNLKSLPSGSNSTFNRSVLKKLALRHSRIEYIPDSIYNLSHLESLDLLGCDNLKRCPPFGPMSMGCFSSLRNLNLSCCPVSKIPDDSMIWLPSLEDIDLSGTKIEIIPSSIINVSGLRRLTLGYCTRLEVIPELPWQLETLDADGCTSLKNVASSRSAIMQNRQHYKGPADDDLGEEFAFSGCLALDDKARSNIVDDAQARFMRASSWKQGCMSYVTYPGYEIPGWFSYQSEGCSISINFPGTMPEQKCLKIAISFVVEKSNSTFPSDDIKLYYPVFDCNFKTNDGEAHQYNLAFGWGYCRSRDLDQGDQVWVMFLNDSFLHRRLSRSSNSIHLNEITHASFHFYLEYDDTTTGKWEREERRLKVKKCGVHLFYNDSPTSANFSSEISRVF